jgi:hypothetical protein
MKTAVNRARGRHSARCLDTVLLIEHSTILFACYLIDDGNDEQSRAERRRAFPLFLGGLSERLVVISGDDRLGGLVEAVGNQRGSVK